MTFRDAVGFWWQGRKHRRDIARVNRAVFPRLRELAENHGCRAHLTAHGPSVSHGNSGPVGLGAGIVHALASDDRFRELDLLWGDAIAVAKTAWTPQC